MAGMKPGLARVNSFASVSTHKTFAVADGELLRIKSLDAAAHARARHIHCFHASGEERLHRMLNAIQPGSYIRPHRHSNPPKPEAFVVLSGAVGFVLFDDQGEPLPGGMVLLDRQGGPEVSQVMDIRENVWHAFFALKPDSVLFEVKPGPYDPAGDKEPAPWAPAEDSPEAGAYLAALEERFRREFGIQSKNSS